MKGVIVLSSHYLGATSKATSVEALVEKQREKIYQIIIKSGFWIPGFQGSDTQIGY